MPDKKRVFLGVDQYFPELHSMILAQGHDKPLPGVIGLKIDSTAEQTGARPALTQIPQGYKRWVDLKLFGTPPNVARRVAAFAAAASALTPHYLTVAAEIGPRGVRAAVDARGNINIVVVPMLSTTTPQECLSQHGRSIELVTASNIMMALEAGAQALTCPAHLLPILQDELRCQQNYKPFVIATGIRVNLHAKSEHYEPRRPEWAIQHGAHAVVMESEVLGAEHPLAALAAVNQRLAAADKKAA